MPMLDCSPMKRREFPPDPNTGAVQSDLGLSPAKRQSDHGALFPRSLAFAGLLCLLLTTISCGPASAPSEEVDKAEIQQVLEAYLPVLGKAYANGSTSSLEPWAVPKEQARIRLRIDELEARGQVYEPELKSVTVENISVWNYSNAFVTTVEVWDVRAYTLGTRMVVNESLDQRSRVKYQMKRKGDGWSILYRELEKTSDE